MKDIKNSLLTKLFSILLAISLVVFILCTSLTLALRGGKYDYKRVTAKVTQKYNQSSNVVLMYEIHNGCRTEISLIHLSTKVYVNNSYVGAFKSSFSGYIEGRRTSYFSCKLDNSLSVYQTVRENSSYALDFEIYLTAVYFADYTSFTGLNYKISPDSK